MEEMMKKISTEVGPKRQPPAGDKKGRRESTGEVGAAKFSAVTEKALAQASADHDPLDAADFDPIAYINRIFPGESSLTGVDTFIGKMRFKIRELDEQVVVAIREQSKSGTKAKNDLIDAEKAINDLFLKLKEIKSKSEQSETMVQEISRDIKALDYGKRHLTTTITTLKRLQMLVTAVDQLRAMAASKQYREAANLLEATKQLCLLFDNYRRIQAVGELQDQINQVEKDLRHQVFEDFMKGINAPRDKVEISLSDACKLIDALGSEAKKEIIIWYSSVQFAAYRNAFQPMGDAAALDKTERRYAWMKKLLRQYDEDHSNIFPSSWLVDERICIDFVEITAKHMSDILEQSKESLDVTIFMHVLQKTVEFEKELAQRFSTSGDRSEASLKAPAVDEGAESQPEDAASDPSVQAIKERYKKMRAQQQKQEERFTPVKPTRKPESNALPVLSHRKWTDISQAFEPYMDVYVRMEDKNIKEFLQKIMQEETWTVVDAGNVKILVSSSNIFLYIKRILKRCSSYTRGRKMVDLYSVFKRALLSYSQELDNRIPQLLQGVSQRLSETEEKVVCYIINTAEYCYETSQQLSESVKRLVTEELAPTINVEAEQDAFHGVSTKGIKILVNHLISQLEDSLVKMLKINWASNIEVGDCSEFVNDIGSELTKTLPTIAQSLTPTFLRFFCDKFVSSFAQRYAANIYKCKRVSETSAQQMLLDLQTLQLVLVRLPVLGANPNDSSTIPSSFKSFVEKEMDKLEAMLKVVGSPSDAVLPTFMALIPEGTPFEFGKILELKGLKKLEISSLTSQLSTIKSKESGSRPLPPPPGL